MKRISDYFKRATEPEAVDPGTEAEIVDEDEEELMLELDEDANVTEETVSIPSRKKYRFNADWQKTFPWLLYENKLMYCKYYASSPSPDSSLQCPSPDSSLQCPSQVQVIKKNLSRVRVESTTHTSRVHYSYESSPRSTSVADPTRRASGPDTVRRRS